MAAGARRIDRPHTPRRDNRKRPRDRVRPPRDRDRRHVAPLAGRTREDPEPALPAYARRSGRARRAACEPARARDRRRLDRPRSRGDRAQARRRRGGRRSARLCGRSVPQIVSDFLLDLHRANGVDVRLGAALASLDAQPDDASKVRATLADGTTIDADFAVAGIGLALNASLASDAGWRSTTASSSTNSARPATRRFSRAATSRTITTAG